MALMINGETIADDVLYAEFDSVKNTSKHGPGGPHCCERDVEFMEQAKRNIVSRVLLMQEARSRPLPVEPAEIERAFDNLMEQHGGRDKFFRQFEVTHEQEPQIRENLRMELIVSRHIDEQYGVTEPPTDEQLQAYYHAHIDLFMSEEEVHAAHIMKNLQHGEDRKAAFEALTEARGLLLAGDDFVKVCRIYSDNPEKDGDLGFFARGDIVEEFEVAAFSLNVGEISPIILTPFGYHLIQVLERKPAAPYPLQEIREHVAERFMLEQRNEKLAAFVEKLKGQAKIEEIEAEGSGGACGADGDCGH